MREDSDGTGDPRLAELNQDGRRFGYCNNICRRLGSNVEDFMAEPNKSPDLPDWIKNHISRYVATDGADGYLWDASIGGGKGMVPTLLLTTVGRKSGRVLTLPLIFGRSGSNYVVVASKGGAPAHPAWYLNLQANPEVQVQVKAEKFTAL